MTGALSCDVLAAVGVDEDGKKYVLGVRSGASENATVTTALLEDLVARGIRPDRRRLFVVDGAKALRSAIAQVFGAGNEVQRCRNHKLRNVVGHLPNAQHDQARATLRAAWKLDVRNARRAGSDDPNKRWCQHLQPVTAQLLSRHHRFHQIDTNGPLRVTCTNPGQFHRTACLDS